MAKSKVKMDPEVKKQCQIAIHTATAAAAAAGAIPIPMSDAIPISAAQVLMVVSIGKAFGVSISDSVAKSILGLTLTQRAGRAVASNILKAIPGVGTVGGGVIGAGTAAALTETLGWSIADDFQRIQNDEEPENIIDAATVDTLRSSVFEGLRMSKDAPKANKLRSVLEGLRKRK
jgi:uncharacterized protein (DUF697 family)